MSRRTVTRFRSGTRQAHLPGVRIPPELTSLAVDQHGVVHRAQALAAGLSDAGLRRRIEAGQLEVVGQHTLRFAGQPETWRQRLQIGLLDVGPTAVVARRSAACLLGLDGFEEGPVQLLVPRPHRERRTPVGRVHSVASLPLIDKVHVEGFPVTSAARTIVDLAAEVTRRELEDAVDSALRLGWTSEPFLRARLAALRHRGRTGVRRLDEALDGAGGHSRLERIFLQLVRRAGLPKPECQRIHTDDGRFVARTDFSWSPRAVVAEVAGHRTHSTRHERERDAQRHAELSVLGWLVLTFTYEQVTRRPDWVLTVLRRVLAPRFASAHPSPSGA
jgi:very-short-patch-repair endonuclease